MCVAIVDGDAAHAAHSHELKGLHQDLDEVNQFCLILTCGSVVWLLCGRK